MQLRINGRLYILIALFAVGCAILATALTIVQARQDLTARQQSLVQLVDVAMGVFASHDKLVANGEMSLQDAQKRALSVLDSMRYNGTDYFFVRDLTGMTLLSPASPQNVGTRRDDTSKDANGKLFLREMTELARGPAGQGFVTYTFNRPGTTEQSEKISFIKTYKPWGYTIATGVYTKDLHEARIASAWQAFLITAGLLIVLGAVTFAISNSIARPLQRLNSAMKQIIEGKDVSLAAETARRDEIGEMAHSVARFHEATIARARAEEEAAQQRLHAAEQDQQREREKADEARRMQVTIDALGGGLTRLAQGDLMCHLDAAFPPETEKLRHDFNAAVGKLSQAIVAIVASTSNISSGAYEITTASDDLSRRTEQQAATLEETAAALDQITATVKKAAIGTSHAREVVTTAKADAETGGIVVSKAVEAMSGIEKSSEQIGQILGVIDEIAFQTNLLALNAGVEAARAGEAGRGFAVVAAEVRALAQRSADAAKEIKEIIRLSAVQVAEGVSLVGQTGKSLERIMAQVNDINAVVSELATGAQEQATSLTQVNTALNDMDGVTQQNAAMVEQTTAASHTLRKESETLTRLIQQFHIEGAEAPAKVAAAREAPAKRPVPRQAGVKPRIVSSNQRPAAARATPDPKAEAWQDF